MGEGGHFLFSFIPSDPVEPCLGDGSCQLGFSFGGDAVIPGNPVIPAGGFGQLGDLGALNLIQGPPILPFDPFEGQGPPIRLDGRIVAFDDPELVGTFTVTLSAVPEPSSAALLLMAALPLPFVLRRRRATVRCSSCTKPVNLMVLRATGIGASSSLPPIPAKVP